MTQNYFERKFPTIGGGITFGYNYYFPDDLNKYIDLTMSGLVPNVKKEHIHTGMNVGLFFIYAPNKHFEIVPELNYFFKRHNFSGTETDLVVNNIRLGGTVYYLKFIYPGINLRFGAGISNYWGSTSWEYPDSNPQPWKGSIFGFHGTSGVELILSKNMSVSILLIGQFAKIKELKNENDIVLKMVDGTNKNLQLNFSGLELKILLSYYTR